jgi:methylase of polypeptide subunit release factors
VAVYRAKWTNQKAERACGRVVAAQGTLVLAPLRTLCLRRCDQELSRHVPAFHPEVLVAAVALLVPPVITTAIVPIRRPVKGLDTGTGSGILATRDRVHS